MAHTNTLPLIDPVCGMDITSLPDVLCASFHGTQICFCGEGCADRFKNNPEKFQGIPLIELCNVWKTFRMGDAETHALHNLSFRIWEEDFVAIIGASGSGKSTALNMLGLLDRPTAGTIMLRGTDVSILDDERRAELRSKTFGFVFQQYNLIPWLTAYENVALPLIFTNKNRKKEELLAQFREMGLAQRMDHRPAELSGGEQQRTAILRALANNPEIILADEPTGNLDSATGNKILDILMRLKSAEKKTLVVVTHDADIAARADEVLTLKDGQMLRHHKAHTKIYTE